MTDLPDLPDGWETRGRPPALFKRFEFERYGETRVFLDDLAALTEELGVHPQNINFGTTYVNITLESADGGDPGTTELELAGRINTLRARMGN